MFLYINGRPASASTSMWDCKGCGANGSIDKCEMCGHLSCEACDAGGWCGHSQDEIGKVVCYEGIK